VSNYQILEYEAFWRLHELSANGIHQTLENYAGTRVDTPANRCKAYNEYVKRMNNTENVLHKSQPVKKNADAMRGGAGKINNKVIKV
jgi:hypothetical protein